MTTDPYEAAENALLEFAGYLEQHSMPAPMPSSIYAELARERSDCYRDKSKPLPAAPPKDLRVEALHAATHWLIGNEAEGIADVLAAADEFLAWLRSER